MPLEILGPLVVFGIIGIAILLHFTGHSKPFRFASEQAAQTHWQRHNPEATAQTAHLSDDNAAALITTPTGLGLVWAIGDSTTARTITPDTRIIDTAAGFTITFHDIAAPRLTVTLTNPETRLRWNQTLAQNKGHTS